MSTCDGVCRVLCACNLHQSKQPGSSLSLSLTDCIQEELHGSVLVDLGDREATVDHTPLDLQTQQTPLAAAAAARQTTLSKVYVLTPSLMLLPLISTANNIRQQVQTIKHTKGLTRSAMKHVAATVAPILPTVAATCASFSCRGVCSSPE